MARRPFVYWAQNQKLLFLTIDLKDSSDADYTIVGNLFEFRATGVGAHGRCEYSFELPLFADVEIEKAGQEGGSKLLYILRKKNDIWWPTVLKGGGRYSWLRIDFDRFEDPDGSETDEDYEMINMNARTPEAEMDAMTQRILKECRTRPKTKAEFINEAKRFAKKCSCLLTHYLSAFNLSLFILHAYLLFILLFKFFTVGSEYYNSFWQNNVNIIKITTALQLIDITHALIGFTKGSYQVGLIQVCGRLAFIYIIDGCPDVQNLPTTFILMIAYFSIEVIRYPYYMARNLKIEISLLTWLRYNAWMLLYPVGLLLEGVTVYRAIPYYYQTGKYSVKLPNFANIGFNFSFILGIFLLFVFPFMAVRLLRHMWLQRCKKYRVSPLFSLFSFCNKDKSVYCFLLMICDSDHAIIPYLLNICKLSVVSFVQNKLNQRNDQIQ
uniref:Very-long-chain (3R)-3-hydroxyacyl-CoA dehydratase n=1 Tax=Onchocerca volvulus TaxID=6282 RepID=A0A8R1XWG2_ONCVO